MNLFFCWLQMKSRGIKGTIHQGKQYDIAKWIVIIIFFVLGISASYHYSSYPLHLQLIGWIGLVAILLAIAAFTSQGNRFIVFAGDARIELLKVVWPSKQETTRSTMLVIIMVLLVSFILWALDSSLFWAVSKIAYY